MITATQPSTISNISIAATEMPTTSEDWMYLLHIRRPISSTKFGKSTQDNKRGYKSMRKLFRPGALTLHTYVTPILFTFLPLSFLKVSHQHMQPRQ